MTSRRKAALGRSLRVYAAALNFRQRAAATATAVAACHGHHFHADERGWSCCHCPHRVGRHAADPISADTRCARPATWATTVPAGRP